MTTEPGAERLLVIDCATPCLSLALLEAGEVLAAHHELLGRGHAEALMPAIARLPEGGRADRILVDVGPGSFTGVRVGIAAARALGSGWRVPVHGYVCHALVAAMAREQYGLKAPFPVVMTGGHGELFWTIAAPGQPIAPADISSTPIAQLADRIDAPTCYGSGAQKLIEARGDRSNAERDEAIALLPDARCIGLLAPAEIALAPSPVYGRDADATPMAARAGQATKTP